MAEEEDTEDEQCDAPGCTSMWIGPCMECGGKFCAWHLNGFVCDWCYSDDSEGTT